MFCFDIETLDLESTAVVLSAAIVYFDPKKETSYQELLDRTLFVKFNVSDQIQRLHRTIGKSTAEWWESKPEYIKKVSLYVSNADVVVEDGYDIIMSYINSYQGTHTFWARGNMDDVVFTSLLNKVDKPPIAQYNMWRDVRTAIDIIYGTTNGYCDVTHPDFNRDLVLKHHPAHDVCLDVMMLLYGKQNV